MMLKKTRDQIAYQFYVTQADIRKLFECSNETAKRIYKMTDAEFDSKEKFRVEPRKVKLTNVCKLTGLTLQTIQKQACGQKKAPQQQVL